MGLRILIPLLIIALSAGCATRQSSMLSPAEFSETARTSKKAARVLNPGDKVSLSVEVNGRKEVTADSLELNHSGAIPAPLIGDLHLAGMTLERAREELETGYGRVYVVKPLITIRLTDENEASEWGFVTVLGQVGQSGRYPVSSSLGMNLSDALNHAGGFSGSADISDIMITRVTESGETVQCMCDIKRFGKAGASEYDLILFDGDVVYVPERLL